MSLILEALRKSEAERRRAQVPDLLAEPQVAAPVARRAPPRFHWIAAGLVVVLAAAWFVLKPSAPPAVAAAADAPPPAPEQVEAIEAPAPTPTTQPASRPANLHRPLVVATPAPAAPATRIAPPPTTEPKPVPVQVAAAPLPPPPARAEPVAPPSPAPAFDTVERVGDLGNDDRKQLPPLKLTMHMWNDVSAQRFVIIDGARLSVGDRFGALVVADIVPDGVVLDWNGRVLKLPLR